MRTFNARNFKIRSVNARTFPWHQKSSVECFVLSRKRIAKSFYFTFETDLTISGPFRQFSANRVQIVYRFKIFCKTRLEGATNDFRKQKSLLSELFLQSLCLIP